MFADWAPAALRRCFRWRGIRPGDAGHNGLPTGFDRVVVYPSESGPRDGELRPTKISQAEMEGRTGFRFEGFVRDAEGKVIMELQGVEMVELGNLDGFPARIFEQMLPVAEMTNAMEKSRETVVRDLLHEDEAAELERKANPKGPQNGLQGERP